MAKEISSERKAAYCFGLGSMAVGGVLFAYVFMTAALGFGDSTFCRECGKAI